jgi:hypothetical protein
MNTTVRVNNFDDSIKSVTPKGIVYINSDGKEDFLDFTSCHSHYLNTFQSVSSREQATESRRVGQRALSNKPPYIEFFAMPLIRFEFDFVNDCHQLRHLVRKTGWTTMDLA